MTDFNSWNGFSILMLILAAGTAGCSGEPPVSDNPTLTAGNTAFACDLYHQVQAVGGNLFCSPYSISAALAMTYSGARDATASEMAQAMHFPPDAQALAGSFAQLSGRFDAIAARKQVQLSVANSMWCERDYPFLDAFLNLNRRDYRAEIRSMDFAHEPEAARHEINSWVEQKTRDKIRDLLKAGQITSDTRLVLCNAVYFKGDWAKQFDPKATTQQPFFLSATRSNQVPMMSSKLSIRFRPLDGFNILELPYEGEELSMIILLPEAVDGLSAVESRLNANDWTNWTGTLSRSPKLDAIVELPRFKLDCRLDLGPTLAAMGMPAAFGPGADFSGMTGKRDLFISAVVHQAFVEVNEQGTEAAAATGVVMMRSAMTRPTILRMDHPFLFAIVERQTGTILFLGRLANPSP